MDHAAKVKLTDTIAFRLSLAICAMSWVVMGGFAAVNYMAAGDRMEDALQGAVQRAGTRLQIGLPNGLWNLDKAQTAQVLAGEIQDPAVVSITVTDPAGQFTAGVLRGSDGKPTAASSAPAEAGLHQSFDLRYDDAGQVKPLGKVRVGYTRELVDAALRSAMLAAFLNALAVAVVLTGVGLVALKALVGAPLHHLQEAMRRIASGQADLTRRIVPQRHDEIAVVAAHFNAFVERLQATMLDIRGNAEQLDTSTKEIAAGSADLSRRTELQAGTLESTASTAHMLSTAVQQSTSQAEDVARSASAASQMVGLGNEAVSEIVQTMEAISTTSRRISDISAVIDGIAFQTNILALNAAVEAARAGEQGRGFAVVAGEVRTLAGRAAEASREIKGLVEETVRGMETGNARVTQAGETMRKASASVDAVAQTILEIIEVTQRQTAGVAQIHSAVQELDQNTQQNTALAEQSAAATAMIREQAGNLFAVVKRFRIDASEASPASREATAATETAEQDS